MYGYGCTYAITPMGVFDQLFGLLIKHSGERSEFVGMAMGGVRE